MAEIHAALAERRADATYEKKAKAADERFGHSAAAAALALEAADGIGGGVSELFAGRRIGKREGWERLCILTDCDHVKGVLEYWEDKEVCTHACFRFSSCGLVSGNVACSHQLVLPRTL